MANVEELFSIVEATEGFARGFDDAHDVVVEQGDFIARGDFATSEECGEIVALMSAKTPGGDEPWARLCRSECDETDIVANLRKGPRVVAA